MVVVKTDDRWAFLEEIEAPMWVDLPQEALSYKQNDTDEWFQTSHPFHQCSSEELKSAVAQFSGSSDDPCFELPAPTSPTLPASVSRSRGKDYKSTKWRGSVRDFPLAKQHQVKLPSPSNSGSANRIKTVSRFTSSKGSSVTKPSSVCDSSTSGIVPNSSRTSSDTKGLTSLARNTAESRTSSSFITTDTNQQQRQKSVGVSSQASGQTQAFLSAMRKSLRKSHVTRQASRVEKSYSSKSSAGSSGNAGSCVGSSISTFTSRFQEESVESTRTTRLRRAAQSKGKPSCVEKEPKIQLKHGTSNIQKIGSLYSANSGHQDAAKPKPKVLNQHARAKVLVPRRSALMLKRTEIFLGAIEL